MAIRWDKFTVKAQEAVQRSSELASGNGNPELQPVHVLAALVENAGRVMSKDQLEQRLYGWQEEVDSNTVEVHVHHLRRPRRLRRRLQP